MTTHRSTLADEAAAQLSRLGDANRAFSRAYPGDPPDRQPVHTVYGGAHLFSANTAPRLGELALRSLTDYAPDAFTFARALGLSGAADLPDRKETSVRLEGTYEGDPETVRKDSRSAWLAITVYRRLIEKLKREPVEDFRIDFEDGYGNRPDDEEDHTATAAAQQVVEALRLGTMSPFFGIRIKPLNEELKLRAVRTLDLFVTTLVRGVGKVPDGFVVTLPKVPVPEQVSTLVSLFEVLERRLGLPSGALRMELMIELPQSLLDAEGRSNLPLLLRAANGRCRGAHFGTYDYTASCNITAAWQTMAHPACDFALQAMKVAYAGTGLLLSDGATNVMPVGPHRAASGSSLAAAEVRENTETVHRAWRLCYEHIRRSLVNGYYQGWDLHPAQLPVRYGACFAFFLEGLVPASERLRNFVDKAAQATLVGDVFDDAATGQGLLNYFLRALGCGAISLEEVASTGLTVAEIQTRSFLRILEGRTRGSSGAGGSAPTPG
jgi:citrate lyase beta subunit